MILEVGKGTLVTKVTPVYSVHVGEGVCAVTLCRVYRVRSTSAKTKGLDYSLRLNLGLSPNLRLNLIAGDLV